MAKVGAWELNIVTNKSFWSKEAYKIIEEVESSEPYDLEKALALFHEQDRKIISDKIEQTMKSGGTWEVECPLTTAKGNQIFVRIKASIILKDGKPVSMVGAIQNITDRYLAEVATKKALTLLQDIANRVPGMVYQYLLRTDGTACFPYSSEGIRDIYRVTPAEAQVSTQKIMDELHPDDFAATVDSINLSAKNLTPWRHEFRVKFEDGTVNWLFGNALPQKQEDGSVLWHGFITDITKRKMLEQKLNEAMIAAEESNQAKDNFLATLSHELRTPLTSILGWAQLIKLGTLDEVKTKKGILNIEASAKTQKKLIDDLLDVSRIVSGKLSIVLKLVDLIPILSNAIDTVRPNADRKLIKIETNFSNGPIMVKADVLRLGQVFSNVLTNSVKFTDNNGFIKVSLNRVTDQNQNQDHVEIIVQDNGAGISADFIPHLFNRFSQEDSSSIRSHGGLGIGLALAKNLLDLQDGKIKVTSAGVGQGATFTIILPVCKEKHQDDGLTASKADVSNLKILYVDDDESSRVAISEMLMAMGMWVETAVSASEAMMKLSKTKPDLILSDISMPGEDGYSLIKKIRSLGPNEGGLVPAIALTALDDHLSRDRSVSSGFQCHLAKPVDMVKLLNTIMAIVKK